MTRDKVAHVRDKAHTEHRISTQKQSNTRIMLASLRRAPVITQLARRAFSTTSRFDPYACLGVQHGCSSADLKAAYLKLAMQYHPDRNPQDPKKADLKFKEIAQAYNQLNERTSAMKEDVWSFARRETPEELFWRLYGVNGQANGAQRWQQYAKVVDSLDDSHILSGAESRSLYREVLRELRGVEADVSTSVRDTAREKLRESRCDASAEEIRCLLIDGRHQLDSLRHCLGTAVIKPEWALRPGIHVTRRQLEQQSGRGSHPGLTAVHGCLQETKEEKERSWAIFVETKLQPAFEEARQARTVLAAKTSPQACRLRTVGAIARWSSAVAGAVGAFSPGGQRQVSRSRYGRGLATSAGPETPEVAIRRLHAVMLDAAGNTHETFTPTVGADGMLLTIDLGDKGQYSMQAHHGQLLLFSPVSGPCYYDFDGGNHWWKDPKDGHLLDEKLVREIMHITSVYLNL